MKIALITDTHFGARNDNVAFGNYFKKFYDNVLFPYIDQHNIKTIIHLGDIVDRRKFINFLSARRLREDLIAPAINRGIDLHMLIGNHDTFFKNTNDVNSMQEMYAYCDKIKFYPQPVVREFNGCNIALIPWICPENEKQTFDLINTCNADILFGHLEVAGFEMYKGGMVIEDGLDHKVFEKFDLVCSGHYHHRSTQGNITYLGTAYEITWSDYNDQKGFHIFDTEDRSLTFIPNPHKMFFKVYYDDLNKSMDEAIVHDFSALKDTFVKVIIKNKTNPYWFDLFIERLEKSGIQNLQVVEDHLNLNLEKDETIVNEAEDTLTILNGYIDQLDLKHNKQEVKNVLHQLYSEALTIE